jgi:PST family polysaccharide transporter
MWLARLLTPVDYGVVAMALIVTNFANLIRDMGTGHALIQKEGLNQETILTAFWFTLGLGAVLGIVVVALAPLIALAFEEPAVSGVLWVLAVTFPLLGSTTVNKALLERESRFPLLARVETVSSVSGLAVGVSAAYLGAGPYSLALSSLAYALVSSAQLWLASPLRPRWLWSQHEFRAIRRFSDHLVAFTVVNYLAGNVDKMIIGRFLGADSLGLYSVAHRIMLFPLSNLTFVASRALYPVMSRQQAVPEEMAALFLRTLSVIGFVTAPIMAGVTILREPFIEVLLGSKWLPMGDVLVWLAPLGFIKALDSSTGSVLMARGRTDTLFYLGIADAVLRITGYITGLHWGVPGVAAGYFFATAVATLATFYYVVHRELGQGIGPLLRSVLTPIALAGVMVLVILACREMLPVADVSAIVQLVALALVGALTCGTPVLVFARQPLRDVFRFVGRR